MPSNVEIIPAMAFKDCKKLKKIKLSCNLTKLGKKAFYDCECLVSIELPDSIKIIDEATFALCFSLRDIKWPSRVEEIGSKAFEACQSLKAVCIPDAVKVIGKNAFAECSSLEEVTLPEGLEEIGNSAFYDAESLIQCNLPESLRVIGSWAFYNSGLKEITLPSLVRHIGVMALPGSLKTLEIKEGVPSLDEVSINCSEMESIVIPNSLQDIMEHTFRDVPDRLIDSFPEWIKKIIKEQMQTNKFVMSTCIKTQYNKEEKQFVLEYYSYKSYVNGETGS